MKKVTRLMSAILSAALLASVVTVAPFSVGATETDQDVSVAYSEESAEAIPEFSSEQATEPPIEETTVESHIIETTVAQTVEETSAVPKTQNSPKSIESVGASAGESVSVNGIENKINTLSQAFANAEITHFTNNGEAAGSEESNCYLPNINDSLSKAGLPTGAEAVSQGASAGYSCYGFASYVFWYLYGSNFRYAPTASTPSYGDLLEFNGAHYAIYLGERNGNYYVYDSNWDYQCTIQMHEIPKSWNTPVTIYHASNYAQVFDSEPPKTGGHVDFQRGTTMQGATPINTFVLKYTASDNIGVSRVYAHVWEFGQTEDQARTYEGALSGQNVTVTIPQSEMPESTYSIECYAEDATGNRASIGVKRTYFPIYKVIEDTGTYQVTADTAPVRHSPYEKINGKSTDSGQYHKGLKVSITGYYINSYGNKWYQLDNSNWIYSGNIKKCFQWSDVWNAINPFVGKNEKFYYFSDQAIMAGETISSKSGASVGAGVDEDSAVGVQNYIRVTGTSPEYYSVNGGNTTYYTITFDANGGSLSTTSKTVVGGSSMGYSPIPYRLGYQFDGWFTAAENGVQYTSDTVVNGNITLYAHWTRIILLQGSCGNNLQFILYADGELVISGSGSMTSHPWNNNYSKRVYQVTMSHEVTSFCDRAFENCIYLLPFVLPNINSIPYRAFAECDSITQIDIPDSVSVINSEAFNGCDGLTTISIPDSVTKIANYAFNNCVSLSNANLPTQLTELGRRSFAFTSISSVQIPKTLVKADYYSTYSYDYNGSTYSIPDGPFYCCEKLNTASFESGSTQVAANIFSGCTGLQSVVIPDSVTAIKDSAFNGCLRLSVANMPDSLVNLGKRAFAYSAITNVEIPNTLERADYYSTYSYDLDGITYQIPDGPFYRCEKLKTAAFEDGTVTVVENVFGGCTGLETVFIPDSVTSIKDRAFYCCLRLKQARMSTQLTELGIRCFAFTAIESVWIPKTMDKAYCYSDYSYEFKGETFSIFDGPFYRCEKLKSVSFEDEITEISQYLFAGCTGLEEITIPSSVTTIEASAFRGCLRLRTANISDSVTKIDNYAFTHCVSLTTANIPKSLAEMGYRCFGFTALESVTIPKTFDKAYFYSSDYSYVINENSYYIPDGPFYRCENLKTVVFDKGVTEVSQNLFAGCTGLEEITIPNSITTIEASAFRGCLRLETANIGNNVTKIDNYAFTNCISLKNANLPKSLTEMGYRCFGFTALENVTIPKAFDKAYYYSSDYSYVIDENSYYIPDGPFYRCENLKTVVFDNDVTEISQNLFAGCTGLEEIVIPESIEKIENSAFRGCVRLSSIIVPDSVSSMGTSVFLNCVSLKDASLSKNVSNVMEYTFYGCISLSNVNIPNSVTVIQQYAFYNCNSLESIALPRELEKINNDSFRNCVALKQIIIPEKVTSIYSNAFYNCTSLTKAILSSSLNTISNSAFANCTSLEEVDFSTGVKTIGSSAFSGCALTQVELPDSVQTINDRVFQNCFALSDVTIPSSVKTLGSYAFQNCELLENVFIADYSIKEIADSTFKDCPSIQMIILPKGLTKISNLAFGNDTELSAVEIPESVTTIANNAFSYPDILTVYGKTGSYAEQYCDNQGITFIDNHIDIDGLVLSEYVSDDEDYVALEIGETREIMFDYYPEEGNDVIELTSDNNKLNINGMHITSRYSGDSIVTATTSSGTEYSFTVHNRSVSNISVKSLPNNLKVIQGNDLDTAGLLIQVNYNDEYAMVTNQYSISGFNSNTLGIQTINVTYKALSGSTYTTTFNIEVVDPRGKQTGIKVIHLPNKVRYIKKEKFDSTGLEVVAVYDSGFTEPITDYKLSGYNALKTGKQTVKVTKDEFVDTFVVEVINAPSYAFGDANCDGKINIRDVTAIQRHLVELETLSKEQLIVADVNGDNTVDIADATLIQMYLAEYDVVLG